MMPTLAIMLVTLLFFGVKSMDSVSSYFFFVVECLHSTKGFLVVQNRRLGLLSGLDGCFQAFLALRSSFALFLSALALILASLSRSFCMDAKSSFSPDKSSNANFSEIISVSSRSS